MTFCRLTILFVLMLLGLLAGFFFIRGEIHRYDNRIVTRLADLETAEWSRPRVAIVFGASVHGNRDLSPILADRVERAIDLYEARKVDRILVSGDNRHPNYNEPGAMYDYLVARQVPPDHIIVDTSGRSTYETCLRAREVFGLRQAVLVSQGFHLPRALFIANELGLSAVGMAGDLRLAKSFGYQNIREVIAELKAWFNIRIAPPAELESRVRGPIGDAQHATACAPSGRGAPWQKIRESETALETEARARGSRVLRSTSRGIGRGWHLRSDLRVPC